MRILLANCPDKAKRSNGQSRRGAIYRAQGWGGDDTIEFASSILMDVDPRFWRSVKGIGRKSEMVFFSYLETLMYVCTL